MERNSHFRMEGYSDRFQLRLFQGVDGAVQTGDRWEVEVVDFDDPGCPISQALEFRFLSVSGDRATIETDATTLEITLGEGASFGRFLGEHQVAFADLLTAAHAGDLRDDIFWLAPAAGGGMWLLGARFADRSSRASLSLRPPVDPSELLGHYQARTGFQGGDRRPFLRHAVAFLRGVIGGVASFPIFGEDFEEPPRRLIVRCPKDETWVLLIPFEDLPRHEEFIAFRSYQSTQALITDKSFLQHSAETRLDEAVLGDPFQLACHGVFIVNTYGHFDNKGLEAANLLVEALDHFVPRYHDGRDICLRYSVNPSADEVLAILGDTRNRYVFANFHTESGRWIAGGGGKPRHVDLARLRPGGLGHVLALRAFHCQSIGGGGLDGETILETLLGLGAHRVEASPTLEETFDYLALALRILWVNQEMRRVLQMTAQSQGWDLRGWYSQVLQILGPCDDP